jgi:hypothetical protein
MNAPSRIEGYAIVSDNGMIATAKGAMPRALKFDADQDFFCIKPHDRPKPTKPCSAFLKQGFNWETSREFLKTLR